MFDKLIARFRQEKAEAHPLGSVASRRQLMSEIPLADAPRVLFEVARWLEELPTHGGEIGLDQAALAFVEFDDYAWPQAHGPLLGRYLTAGQKDFLSERIWVDLERYNRVVCKTGAWLLSARRESLSAQPLESDTEISALQQVACRLVASWTELLKLQRFRYRAGEAALWALLHQALRDMGALGLSRQSVGLLGRGEAESWSPLQRYLLGCYLEMAPLANLTPPQVEGVAALLRLLVPAMVFVKEQTPATTHWVNLGAEAGPRRLALLPDGTAGGNLYFCSYRPLYSRLLQVAGKLRQAAEVAEVLPGLPLGREDVAEVLGLLLRHWSEKPPERQQARLAQEGTLLVVHGFALARRMVATSQFAMAGRSIQYTSPEMRAILYGDRFGAVEGVLPATESLGEVRDLVINPLDTLRALETAGDRLMMSRWNVLDSSESGVGALAPGGLGPKTRIGALIAYRYEDGLIWTLGIIRRIGRDPGGVASIGLSTFPMPSFSAAVKPLQVDTLTVWNEVADVGGMGWLDALLPDPAGDVLLMPKDTFVAGLPVALRAEGVAFDLTLAERLEAGDDYDLVRFERLVPA